MDKVFINAIYNFWVSANYDLIKQSLKDSSTLNNDALHDALIDTYVELQSMDKVSLEEIGKVFNKCYRLASKRIVQVSFKYIPFEDNILEFIINNNYVTDEGFRYINSDNIVKLTRTILTHEEYKLLTLYVWSDNMTLDGLSLYTGIPRTTLHKRINSIKEKVKTFK